MLFIKKACNSKINRLVESCLRSKGNNKHLPFNELLERCSSLSIHVEKFLATQKYKVSKEWSAPIIKDTFPINKKPYTLRHNSQFSRHLLKTSYHKTEGISNLRPKIWNLVPNSLKEIDSLEVFKQAIKKQKPKNCPCRLCNFCDQNVGFLKHLIWKKQSFLMTKASTML